MPIEIAYKQKTVPTSITRHEYLVPLKVTGFTGQASQWPVEEAIRKTGVSVGDIIFSVLSDGSPVVINATTQKALQTTNMDCIGVIRAYEIGSIVLTNDNSPAPVL